MFVKKDKKKSEQVSWLQPSDMLQSWKQWKNCVTIPKWNHTQSFELNPEKTKIKKLNKNTCIRLKLDPGWFESNVQTLSMLFAISLLTKMFSLYVSNQESEAQSIQGSTLFQYSLERICSFPVVTF